jgi:transcriptional regulator with XRE-family HTH domain
VEILEAAVAGEDKGCVPGSSNVKIEGAAFRRFRLKRRLTQVEMAQKMDVSGSRVQQIEREKEVGMYASTIRTLAKNLNENLEDVRAELGVTEPDFDQNVDPYSEVKVPPIPLFDLSVAAGHWVDITEFGELREPGMIDHGYFRVRIRGDSMQPDYKEGDIVEFQCLRKGESVMTVGKDYYVQRDDGMGTFKRLEKADEETLTLRPLNRKKYPKAMEVEQAAVTRMAVAIAIVKIL